MLKSKNSLFLITLRSILLLLFSKKHAQELIEISGISKQKYVVRGLRQYHLKGMLLFVEQLNVSLALFLAFLAIIRSVLTLKYCCNTSGNLIQL